MDPIGDSASVVLPDDVHNNTDYFRADHRPHDRRSDRKSYVLVYVRNGERWGTVARFLQADPIVGNYGSSVALGRSDATFGACSQDECRRSEAGIVYFAN